MKPQYQDLYRRDQERLADWPRKFRGEGPFLPTGRRKPPRLLYTSLALLAAALASLVMLMPPGGSPDAGAKEGHGQLAGPASSGNAK